MNKEQLEKMFDEKFDLGTKDYYNEKGQAIYYENNNQEVIKFIFETIIPEVLKSVLDVEISMNDGNNYVSYGTISIKGEVVLGNIKQKAKELYNINL